MNLREARIGKQGAATGGTPGGGDIAAHRVGRKEKDIAVATGRKDHRIGGMAADFSVGEITHDDAFGVTADEHEIEHLGARVHFDAAFFDFLFKGLIATDEQLLTSLTAGVKGARDLSATEGTVVEKSAILAGKRHALRDALVDDRVRHFGESIDIRLARAEVATLDGVVKQTAHRVAVVAVVFRGVDAPLRGDRMRAARAVLITKAFHLIAQLGKRCGGRTTGQTGADDDHGKFPLVRRVDELGVHLVLGPLLFKRAGWNLAVESDGHGKWEWRLTVAMGIQNFTNFRKTEIGMEMKPSQMIRLKAEEN